MYANVMSTLSISKIEEGKKTIVATMTLVNSFVKLKAL